MGAGLHGRAATQNRRQVASPSQHPQEARMKTPVIPHTRLVICLAAAALISACQKSPAPAAAPSAASAASTAALTAQRSLRGGLQPGDTVTVTNCAEPQPGVCTIAVVATAPAGGTGEACNVVMAEAVSLPRTTSTLRWALQGSDAGYNYRFRAAAGTEPPGFGVHLIDNLMYAPAPPASAASSPMQPIWVHQLEQPQLVQMERLVRDWPPRISAYDVYLEYQAKGAKDWTACKTWDPIIINHD
jgi:hypothetical protein